MLPVYNFDYFKNNLNDDIIEFSISNQLLLEMILMEIRGKTISYSAYKKKQNIDLEKNLIQSIHYLETLTEPDMELIDSKKEELENLRRDKLQGIIVRSRVRWAEEGEKPAKYFCNLESRNYSNKIIPKVVKDDGNTVINQEDILIEVKNFIKTYMVVKIIYLDKIWK